jgi:TolB protein
VTNGAGADLAPTVGRNGGLLYVRDIQELSLYRIDLETAKEERLTSTTSRNYWPRFSPDGRRIAYHSNYTGNWELWLLDLDTKLETRLTNHPAADLGPEWSPDGRRIAFLSNRDRIFQLWVLDVTQGTTSRLLTQELLAPVALGRAGGAELPAHRWSPDGRKIGFLTAGENGATLWSADADGRNAHPALSGILAFDWYRDSGHVVYTRVAPDDWSTRELALMDLENRSEVVLYRGPHVDVTAANDGGAVLFARAASHFYQDLFALQLRRRAHGLPQPLGKPRRLTDGRGLWHVHNAAWSPDGKMVIYSRDSVEADIYLIENYR